jgi:hypothetical protein
MSSKPPWMKNQTNVDMMYCEHCRCWLKNDPMTVRGHEGGRGHREALKRFLIDTRKRKVAERNADDEKTRILRQIEKDAQEAMYGPGVATASGSAGGVLSAPVPAPSSAASALSKGSGANRTPLPGGGRSWQQQNDAKAAGASMDSVFLPKEVSDMGTIIEDTVGDGVYDVDGSFFIMGEHVNARALLVPGALCEALVNDDWLAAVVATPVRDVAVPNTTIVSSRVSVMIGDAPACDMLTSAVRVPLQPEVAESLRTSAAAAEEESDAVVEPAPRDESTGLGLWAAVPAETSEQVAAASSNKRMRVDYNDADGGGDPASLRALHANPSKALDRLEAAGRGTGANAADDIDVGDDAFAAYNPYGGDTYRGFRLNATLGAPSAASAATLPLAASTAPAESTQGAKVAAGEQKPSVAGWALIEEPITLPAGGEEPAVAKAAADRAPLPAIAVAQVASEPSVAFKARAFGGAKGAVRKRISD